MTDRPILFSAPMIRALLEGRKTQTRRVLKPQPPPGANLVAHPFRGDGQDLHVQFYDERGDVLKSEPLRFSPGDRLWVREAITKFVSGERATCHYPADNTGVLGNGVLSVSDGRAVWFWKRDALPAIHMPRWASRLTLTVTDVRVQRLQEIDEADAVAEGVERFADGANWKDYSPQPKPIHVQVNPKRSYATLWDALHGADAWAANPYVAALTFTVALANIDAADARRAPEAA